MSGKFEAQILRPYSEHNSLSVVRGSSKKPWVKPRAKYNGVIPRIITDKMVFTHPGVLTAADVSCLVIPDGCVGLPTLAALEQGIPVIAVKENRKRMRNELGKLPFGPGKLFIAENYPEAVGIMTALKAGVALSSVRRPLAETKISRECAKSYTEKDSKVDNTVRIAKKQAAQPG